MLSLSPQLAGVFLVVVPPTALLAVYTGRRIRDLANRTQDALGEATAAAEETATHIRSVRSFAQEELMQRRYGARIDTALDLQVQETKMRSGFFGFAGSPPGPAAAWLGAPPTDAPAAAL